MTCSCELKEKCLVWRHLAEHHALFKKRASDKLQLSGEAFNVLSSLASDLVFPSQGVS